MASLGQIPEDREKQLRPDDSDFDSSSTRAPSTQPAMDAEKSDVEQSDVSAHKKSLDTPDEPMTAAEDLAGVQDPEEYPTGARLIFIVVALVLSIFLMALDMVSDAFNNKPLESRMFTD